MKLMFIILACIGIPNVNSMDYKKALLPTIVPPTPKLLTRPLVTYATTKEQEEIIEELRSLQSRPELVMPRVDTNEVNQMINEAFQSDTSYRNKTEIAVSIGTPEARQWLLEQTKKPEMFQEALKTLHEYIEQKDFANAQRLLEWTALDANGNSFLVRYRDRFNSSFAHRTLHDSQMLALILDAGANPDARNREYLTPLHVAARSGNLDSVKYLLRAGANPNVRVTNPANPWIETPLFCAIEQFRSTINPDRQYKFFKIAAYLVINKEGMGGNANYDFQNSKGVSAKAYVNQIVGNSLEIQKLKELMLYRKPQNYRSGDSNVVTSLADARDWRKPVVVN